jgi:hypothetical protein
LSRRDRRGIQKVIDEVSFARGPFVGRFERDFSSPGVDLSRRVHFRKIMTIYEQARGKLLAQPMAWLITGVAGFIGSNLAESLLRLNQRVIGLDNFATGKRINLEQVREAVQRKQWAQFTFIKKTFVSLERADMPVRASITCSTKPLSAPCRTRSTIPSVPMKAMLTVFSICSSLRVIVA